jgi:hypothetical protein
MSGLEGLYLAHNLSGPILESFAYRASLNDLDVSFNHLEDRVPIHGVFANVTEFSFAGNDALCGGLPALSLPSCPNKPSEHNLLKKKTLQNTIGKGFISFSK